VPADGTGAAKLKEAETSVRLCFMGSSRTSLISLSMHTHMGGQHAKTLTWPAPDGVPPAPNPPFGHRLWQHRVDGEIGDGESRSR
jgi:hypothetical protein